MDDDAFQRLSRIDEQLLQFCRWLDERRYLDTASRLAPIAKDLTILVAELRVKRGASSGSV